MLIAVVIGGVLAVKARRNNTTVEAADSSTTITADDDIKQDSVDLNSNTGDIAATHVIESTVKKRNTVGKLITQKKIIQTSNIVENALNDNDTLDLWEYKIENNALIKIQTCVNSQFICCYKNGSIDCMDTKDAATLFNSIPIGNGKVALKSDYGYLYIDHQNIKLQEKEYCFDIKQFGTKFRLKSPDGQYMMGFHSKSNNLKAVTVWDSVNDDPKNFLFVMVQNK
eukprot:UN09222